MKQIKTTTRREIKQFRRRWQTTNCRTHTTKLLWKKNL